MKCFLISQKLSLLFTALPASSQYLMKSSGLSVFYRKMLKVFLLKGKC